MQQITINFEAGPVQSFGSCREFIAALVHQQLKPQKTIAADMDYSPSDLSRKLAQSPDDSRRFTLDDLEKFVQVTGDKRAIQYLAEKYLVNGEAERIKQLEAELARLQGRKGVRG